MELIPVPKTALQSSSQTSQQQGSTANAQNTASGKSLLANTVTVAPETSSNQTERRQDRLGKQPDETVSALQVIENLRLTSQRTQLDFDLELNTVFLQIIDVRTEEVIERIPSEELVRQLKRKAESQASSPPRDTSGGAVIDRSV